MPRRTKTLAWVAGESLGQSFNESLIGNAAVARGFRKAAKFLSDEGYREFVDAWNSTQLELDRRGYAR